MGGDTRAMIFTFFTVVLTGLALAREPGVFENYFDDSIKEVDISLDVAIKACLQNGDTLADKVKAAYKKCFGNDYDFDELASNQGSGSDGDGLPDSFEGNEACFYEKMGWVAGDAVAADVIKADLVGLESGMKSEFDGNIDKCAGWSGSFGARRKREAGETETDEEVSAVPSVMGSGSSALSWLRSAVRKTRSAEPDKEKRGRKTSKGKKDKAKGNEGRRTSNDKKSKGKGKRGRNGRKGKKDKAKGKKGRKTSKDKKSKGKGKGEGKGRNGKKGKGTDKGKRGRNASKGKKDKAKGKEGRKTSKDKKGKNKGKGAGKETGGNKNKGRSKKSMDESTYNKLWCFDLSLEQVLEKCVEEKIKN